MEVGYVTLSHPSLLSYRFVYYKQDDKRIQNPLGRDVVTLSSVHAIPAPWDSPLCGVIPHG